MPSFYFIKVALTTSTLLLILILIPKEDNWISTSLILIPMQYKNQYLQCIILKRENYIALTNEVPVVGIINGVPEVLLKIFLTSSIKVFVNAGMAGER